MPELENKRYEAFCKEYRKNGFNGLQAYKTVYKCSDKVAHKRASVLLANIGIKARLEELGKKDSLRYGIDMEELVNDLRELKESGKVLDGNIGLKAIDMLIKIAGGYAPTKIDQKTTVTSVKEVVADIDKDKVDDSWV